MLARVRSGAVYGVKAFPVTIEVNAGPGEPVIVIVGLPDVAVKESKDRVCTAIWNSGFSTHMGRTTVNLAPADTKKEGPSFDLPIAVGMLAVENGINRAMLDHYAVLGELALSGDVRRVRGVLAVAACAKESGCKGIIVPEDNAEEASVVAGLEVHPVKTLRQAAMFLSNELRLTPFQGAGVHVVHDEPQYEEDFADVKGQEQAKRAIEIAVAGGHNILMIGPPGTGKTMLAKRIPSILPEMSLDEAIEVTTIHSIAGVLKPHCALISRRPFRSPHHTVSDAGLLGGGAHPAPGEVSLAHHGVLFLDELPEFHRNVLEVLRQPLEEGTVTIARAAASLTFPCRFMMVAAMNPCPCGYYGDTRRECRCSDRQIHLYRNRISGPLLDRVDIHIEVPSVGYTDLCSLERGEPSASIRQRVVAARNIQQERFKGRRKFHCNADMSTNDLQRCCLLSTPSQEMLRRALTELHFSARAYDKILKVARTIADLAGESEIKPERLREAIQYRALDRQLWL